MTLPVDLRDRLLASVAASEKRAYRGLEPGAVCTPRESTSDGSVEGTISIYLREALKIPFERVRVKNVIPAPAWDLTGRNEVTYVTEDGQERQLSRSTFTACFSVEFPTRYDRILEDEGDP